MADAAEISARIEKIQAQITQAQADWQQRNSVVASAENYLHEHGFAIDSI